MLYPLEAKIKTNILKNKIIILDLSFISFPLKFLLICSPFTISKLDIALINVSIVLNVNETAKIKIETTIKELLSFNTNSKNAKSGTIFELRE